MVLSMDRWKGKVAIVTGASGGCGAAIAEHLVYHGLIVVGIARRIEKIEQLSEKLKGQPGKLHAIKADVSKKEDVEAAFSWITDNLGPVYVLVNSAGIAIPAAFVTADPQTWKDVLDTNVFGVAVATQQAIKNMTDNKVDGHVIHINSIFGHYVADVPDSGMYPSSKFAVTAMTELLRKELNHMDCKIKVTSVSPGLVNTDFIAGQLTGTSLESYFSELPKLQVDDVADAVIYVLSTPPHVQVHELMIRPLQEQL